MVGLGVRKSREIVGAAILAAVLIVLASAFYVRIPRVQAAGADDFVTTWNSGDDKTVKIPIFKHYSYSKSYDFTVDWGDGTIESFAGNGVLPTHVYAEANTEYDIRISGVLYGISFDSTAVDITYKEITALAAKLLKIKQWGANEWKTAQRMFYRCVNLVSEAVDIPNTSKVSDFSFMFYGASKFNSPILFDTSNGVSFGGMFFGASSFNSSVSEMSTSNAQDMGSMFRDATSFNQPLDSLDTSKVVGMAYMFRGASSFNQPLSSFDTKNVSSMAYMFEDAVAFDNDLSSFDTSNVTDMSYMFAGAANFNHSLNNFDTLKTKKMLKMFYNAKSFNQSVSNFDTSNVDTMVEMFHGATSFNQPVDNFNTSNVTRMYGMFWDAASFNQPLDSFDTSKSTSLNYMLYDAKSFNQDISSFNFEKITSGGLVQLVGNTALSTQNNDKLIKRLHAQLGSTLNTQRVFNSGLKYCLAEPEYQYLTKSVANDGAGWTINNTKDCSEYKPQYLQLSGELAVDENSAVGTEIGSLSTTSPVSDDKFTYSTTCATPGAQDSFVTIDGVKLKLAGSPDYEQNQTLSICVRVVNSVGETLEQNFVIAINNLLMLAYDSNGATSNNLPDAGEKYRPNQQIVLPTSDDLTREKYVFVGWNSRADGLGDAYAPGSNYTILQDSTLYAQWRIWVDVAPDMTADTDTGASDSDNETGNPRPEFVVKCVEAGNRIMLYIDGSAAVTKNCDTTGGEITILPNDNLADGEHEIAFTEMDLRGNESQPSPVLRITIDTSAPSGDLDVLQFEEASPALSGTVSDPGAKIEVTINGRIYQAANSGDGVWNLAAGIISPGLNEGDHVILVKFIDAAGNENEISSLLKIKFPTLLEQNSAGVSENTVDSEGTILSETGQNLLEASGVSAILIGGAVILILREKLRNLAN